MIIVLLGKSCAGKDTLAKQLEENGFNFIVSTTSRPMREGERQGNPYHFVTGSDFECLIKNELLIEHRAYNTLVDGVPSIWYYGVEKSEVKAEFNYVAVLDIIGLKGFIVSGFKDIVSIYIDSSDETREARCRKRGDFNEQEWNRRLIDDNKVFSDSEIRKNADFVIDSSVNSLNDVLDIISQIIGEQV